ncbi:permease prefix domain 1-containing protein [Metallumcola ferriviriculae]|uniref:Permease prefix domain 1-containing protein n=1 Tax=Metallumcola ferriviriculae TaxID=3039180 RepID=A0AAU0URH8_9FIRM|nr:permease prefix domain 1-containing protein [Desulfitibacteraceae bacterium MK1]
MPSSKRDKFLEEVLCYVKFPFDREEIKSELECHLSDKMNYYNEQGYDEEKAEQLAISDMGDAKEIGTELNKQHNSFLGWVWAITTVMMVLFAAWNLYILGGPLVSNLFSSPVNGIPKSDVVYKIDVDKRVKLDDTVINFTDVIYEKNGDMNISYEYYDSKLWGTGWSFGGIGNVTDNLGNEYYEGSSYGRGGIKTKVRRTLENFSKKAGTLIISYDRYNRTYRVEIPLKTGDSNE